MSNAELWDLDTSGGIMEQIQMLVAPPISSEGQRRSRRRREREVYRRPGRAVNHDCCDSCKEGGDLLCCDKCPAAFHLLCHDPPLTEETVPTGEWLCHKCKITPQEKGSVVIQSKDDDADSTSSKSSGKSCRGKRTLLTTGTETELEHPLKTLAKAARYMNPMQFDVGKEISCNVSLPGSSKRLYGKNVRNQPKKQAHELDNGLVPLPAKTCFSCNKSCRVAPLIQCDYCPLLFHLDCLNPPLTSLPTGRWMCPNHVEHFLDSHLLKSQSLTERMRLWDRYTKLADSHTVKIDFLNKVHRKHPMFRFKRKLPARPSIAVPSAIKHFYEKPTVLLPDAPRFGPPSTNTISDLPGNRGSYIASLEEQEEWLSSVVSMQASIAKYLAQRQIQKSSDSLRLSDITPNISKPTASVAPVMHREPDSSLPGLTISDDGQKSSPLLSSSSSSSSSSSTNTAIESPDCDTNARQQIANSGSLSNGDQKHFSNNVSNVAFDSKLKHSGNKTLDTPVRGAVSLLPSNLNTMNSSNAPVSGSNGEIDVESDTNLYGPNNTLQGHVSSSLRGRSNSVDSIPSPHTLSVGSGGGSVSLWGDVDNSCTKSMILNAMNKNAAVSKPVSGKPQVSKSSTLPVSGAIARGNTVTSTPTGRLRINPSKANAFNNIVGSSPAITNLNSMLQQWIEGNTVDGEFSRIDEQLINILAWQRLQQLIPSAKVSSQHSPNGTSVSAAMLNSSSATSGKKGLLNVYLSQQSAAEVRSRAVLCPLSGKGQAIPMPYRSLSLGTGGDMDVKLGDYGFCNFISSHHATIFYDEMSRHFELLNYSEHGTTVDNVLYSCDFSDKPATTPQASPVVAAVREIIKNGSVGGIMSKTRASKLKDVTDRDPRDDEDEGVDVESEDTKNFGESKPRMSAKGIESTKPCNCKRSSSTLIGGSGAGWEGTAILHHGSYIKVGCLQFVFSIVDHAPEQLLLKEPSVSNSSVAFGKVSSCVASNTELNFDTQQHSHHYEYENSLHHHSPNDPLSLAVSANATSNYTALSGRFSNMPLLSTSQYLHNQPQQTQEQSPAMSLLKTHLRSNGPP